MKHINEKDLSAFLDHELIGSKRLELENHISACGACRELLNHWTRIRGFIRSDRPPEPSPYFYSKLMYRIRSETKTQVDEIFSIAKWAFGGSFIFSAGILLIIFFWLNPSPIDNVSAESPDIMENRLISKAVNYDLTLNNDDFLEMVYESNGVNIK